MYIHIFNAVTDAIKICQDPVVKNLLVQAQQHTEAIYLGTNQCHPMSVDEETIVSLLTLLRNEESAKPHSQQDADFINECNDWIFDLQEGRTKKLLYEQLNKEKQGLNNSPKD